MEELTLIVLSLTVVPVLGTALGILTYLLPCYLIALIWRRWKKS